MSYLNFEESRRCHNHPGLLLNELRKVTLVTVNSKILPYTVSAAEGLQPTVLSQFYAAGFRCASWALRRIIKRLLMDPCVSLDAWRLELRADGMAEKVVVAPWFDAILPSVKDLIWIQAPSLVKSMRSQVWKQVLSSFPHMDHLQLHPTI